MNKLGLKITKISAGVQELVTINGGDWTRKVVDLRNYTKSLSGQPFEDGASVLMASFTTQGSLLTLFHTIPGRSGDLVSAWIFVPAEVSITADEEVAVIEQVKVEISRPQVENWNRMEALFAKEYPLKSMYFPYRESDPNSAPAVRYYGAGTDFGLSELLGDKLYQQIYTSHCYVFLLDKNAGIVADDKLVNYTADPLQEMVILTPPQLPAGVTAKINGMDFSKPTLAIKGDTMTITLERPGFDPLPSKFTASANPIHLPATLPWVKRIQPADFQVTDNEGHNLNASCRIQINGRTLPMSGITLNEEECNAVNVQVECPRCLPYSNTFNLLLPPPYRVGMEKEVLEVIYLLNGKECPGLTECPKGYSCSEFQRGKKIYRDCTYDDPEDTINWKKIAIIAAAAALLIGMLLGVLLHKAISNRDKKTQQSTTQTYLTTGSDTNSRSRNYTSQEPKEYKCLNKDTWKKAEIEQEKDLKGFFGDVIYCRKEELLGKWTEIIVPSRHPQWNKILEKIREHQNDTLLNGFRVPQDEIIVDAYITMLNQHVAKTQTKATSSKNTGGNTTTDSTKTPKRNTQRTTQKTL